VSELVLSLVALALAVASWKGALVAVEVDDDATVLRYVVVMAGLGGVAFANTIGRF
jgi:hypothetical protein